jgi:hypothetical protein
MPGGPGAGEAAALGADLVVLVAVEGQRQSDLDAAGEALAAFGAAPAWALFVPRRGAMASLLTTGAPHADRDDALDGPVVLDEEPGTRRPVRD